MVCYRSIAGELLLPTDQWWTDPGWIPAADQSYSVTELLTWIGERKCNTRLMGRDKDRERSVTVTSKKGLTWGDLFYSLSTQSE